MEKFDKFPEIVMSIQDYGDGISAVDSGYIRPMLDAIHLVVEQGRVAIVDTGSAHSLPRVVAALGTKGLGAEQVDWVLLTHVHLDHAGGAGAFMREFPNARLGVHPRGGRHMADPSRLWEGAVAVYGESEAVRLYGTLEPVAKDRIVEMPHGSNFRLANREFMVLDTPGHARHHLSIVDSRTGHIFAGDTFGLSYRELDQDGRQFVMPTSSPVQFDPDAEHRTLELLLSHRPEAIYVTHYSQLRNVARLAEDMHRQVDALAEIGRRFRTAGPQRHRLMRDAIIERVFAEGRRHGWRHSREKVLDVLGLDIDLNAQGLASWIDAAGA